MLTKKLQDIVDEALSAGLKVEIKREIISTLEFVDIQINSGYNSDLYKPSNLMQQIVQWNRIAIHATRREGEGKAFKISISRLDLDGSDDKMDPKSLKYAIEDMGRQVDTYLKGKIGYGSAA